MRGRELEQADVSAAATDGEQLELLVFRQKQDRLRADKTGRRNRSTVASNAERREQWRS